VAIPSKIGYTELVSRHHGIRRNALVAGSAAGGRDLHLEVCSESKYRMGIRLKGLAAPHDENRLLETA
jgi:hypothetical protein